MAASGEEFNKKHPRAADGKFGRKGSGDGSGKPADDKAPTKKPKARKLSPAQQKRKQEAAVRRKAREKERAVKKAARTKATAARKAERAAQKRVKTEQKRVKQDAANRSSTVRATKKKITGARIRRK